MQTKVLESIEVKAASESSRCRRYYPGISISTVEVEGSSSLLVGSPVVMTVKNIGQEVDVVTIESSSTDPMGFKQEWGSMETTGF